MGSIQSSYYRGKNAVIATRHAKESVIAPLLLENLGIELIVVDIDTDQFGTFSGEIAREGSSLDAARRKCKEAIRISGIPFAFASEGSFGPHPSIPFLHADHEVVMFMDMENNIELIGQSLTSKTNLAESEVRDWKQLREWATGVGFPTHAIILSDPGKTEFYKGIHDEQILQQTFYGVQNKWGSVSAQTDMRAMHNPLRMESIADATQNLISLFHSNCPRCNAMGWHNTGREAGLPCMICGTPTDLTAFRIYHCNHCGFEKKEPAEIQEADPRYCPLCNP